MGVCFFIFDNPHEQGRCQIHLIFGEENRNLLNIITKNLFSIACRIGCRNQLRVRVDRNDPGRIADPGKNDPVAFDQRRTCRMMNRNGPVFPGVESGPMQEIMAHPVCLLVRLPRYFHRPISGYAPADAPERRNRSRRHPEQLFTGVALTWQPFCIQQAG
ncbi:MAG: hypothetical protein KQI81_00510 [Deltaproteobacteria bacterium]|nr:hypothetical protein [Deltaproteobacteria bacterium]